MLILPQNQQHIELCNGIGGKPVASRSPRGHPFSSSLRDLLAQAIYALSHFVATSFDSDWLYARTSLGRMLGSSRLMVYAMLAPLSGTKKADIAVRLFDEILLVLYYSGFLKRRAGFFTGVKSLLPPLLWLPPPLL